MGDAGLPLQLEHKGGYMCSIRSVLSNRPWVLALQEDMNTNPGACIPLVEIGGEGGTYRKKLLFRMYSMESATTVVPSMLQEYDSHCKSPFPAGLAELSRFILEVARFPR